MNKIIQFIIDFKIRILTEMSVSLGGVGGVLTTIFIDGSSTYIEQPSLTERAGETVLLASLGGIAGAIGGLFIAILWAVYGKPWVKKKFGVDVNHKN